MKDAKDFDVNEFVPDDSTTETTVSGIGARPSKRSVSSEHSELTEQNETIGQTAPTPQSERIEETVSAPSRAQTAKSRQTVSTSASERSVLSQQVERPQQNYSSQPTEQAQTTQPTAPTQQRISSRHRRASLDEYREMFLTIPKITDRQPVFVSRTTRDKIDRIVRLLGERRMSVSGFLENLARHHLELYADDLEQWKRL